MTTPDPNAPAPTKDDGKPDDGKFTQAEVDRIVSDRLKRENLSDLKAAAAELAALKESKKTDDEKVADRIAALEKDTADARAEAMRMRFAAKHGITDEDAALFLTGSDEETLSKQAARLAEVNAAKAAGDKKRTSVVKGEGTTNKNPAGDNEMREFTRQLFASADS